MIEKLMSFPDSVKVTEIQMGKDIILEYYAKLLANGEVCAPIGYICDPLDKSGTSEIRNLLVALLEERVKLYFCGVPVKYVEHTQDRTVKFVHETEVQE
jgi:hypothetical protein